jgi:hypothetical protein
MLANMALVANDVCNKFHSSLQVLSNPQVCGTGVVALQDLAGCHAR